MPLHIEARQERSITVIRLGGEALDSDALRLKESLEEGLQAGNNQLILDVDELRQISSSSLSILVSVQKQAKHSGGDLRLVGADPELLAQLANYRVEQDFDKFDNVDAALTSFDGMDSRGVKHFDILEFVKEQEREEQDGSLRPEKAE